VSAIVVADKEVTFAQLQKLTIGSLPTQIHLDVISIGNFQQFVSVVERAILYALRQLSRNPELRQDHSEDQLTIEVINLLRAFNLDAQHEAKIGGHCDVSIFGPYDFLWLGEAKRHIQDYSWLLKGFQQLDSRYSTGLSGQDHGGLIIYSIYPRIDQVMESWKAHLIKDRTGLTCGDFDSDSNSFFSSHQHDSTGRTISVRHFGCPLHFRPEDKKKSGS